MTVIELIRLLHEMPEEAEVVFATNIGSRPGFGADRVHPIESVYSLSITDRVYLRAYPGQRPLLSLREMEELGDLDR